MTNRSKTNRSGRAFGVAVMMAVTAVAMGDTIDLAPGVSYSNDVYDGVALHVVVIDPNQTRLDLFWKNAEGDRIGGLEPLELVLADRGRRLVWAANAGIFTRNHQPAGLHVEEGVEIHAMNLRDGKGNFHLKPNGVFYLDDAGAHVLTTEAYLKEDRSPRVALQSGPVLVTEGELHPAFRAASKSFFVRSGIGVREDGRVVYVLTRKPVNFHRFARLFRDTLDCPNALYLDGKISQHYIPGVTKPEQTALFTGMLAVTVPIEPETDE